MAWATNCDGVGDNDDADTDGGCDDNDHEGKTDYNSGDDDCHRHHQQTLTSTAAINYPHH